MTRLSGEVGGRFEPRKSDDQPIDNDELTSGLTSRNTAVIKDNGCITKVTLREDFDGEYEDCEHTNQNQGSVF